MLWDWGPGCWYEKNASLVGHQAGEQEVPVSCLRRAVVALSFEASINSAWTVTLTLRKDDAISGITGLDVENTKYKTNSRE
jgi:hypothetical protein